jgi:hypothetical protein
VAHRWSTGQDLAISSGTTSFSVGDRTFLADEAIQGSTPSGRPELSRAQFVELADAHADDEPPEDIRGELAGAVLLVWAGRAPGSRSASATGSDRTMR